jgi:outer membrane receptor protein involved in Fe transport
LFGYPTLDNPASDTDVSPSLSVRYAPSEQLSIYTRAANGFRPGYGMRLNYPTACYPELAALGIDPNADAIVESDSLWSYEVGLKGRFLDGRVSTNISAYRIDWQDLQLSIALDCGFNVAGNAGKVKNNGAEFEMVTLLTPNLTTQLSIGYVDAKLGDDVPTLGGSSGDRLINVPKLSYALGAQYDWRVREHGAFARLDYAYQGDSYFGFRFIESQRKPAYGLLSGRLGMDIGDFQVALYGKNLLNEDKLNLCQRDNFRAVAPDYSTCMVRPRELGLQVRWAPGASSLARK